MAHVWSWFLELRRSVGGGYGIVPISYSEIDAYSRLMRVQMSPFEVRLIRLVDEACVAASSKKPNEPTGKLRNTASARVGGEVANLFRGLGAKKRKRGRK